MESEQGEQSLWLRQLASGQTLRLIPNRRVAYWGHTFTRDGNAIVFGLRGPGDFGGAFYSIATLGGTPRRLLEGVDSAPAFSPDGKRMAWVRARHPSPEESALMVAGSDGTDARVLAAVKLPERVAPIFFTAPDWSPDGRRIACTMARIGSGSVESGARVMGVSVEDGTTETLADPGWRFAAQVAWLPDSRGLLAVAATDDVQSGQVWLVPLPQGAPRRLTNDLLEYRILSLAADGASFVTVAADIMASVWLSSLDGRDRPRRLTSSRLDGILGVAFAPDGRVAYTSAEDGAQGLWITSADAGSRSPLAAGDGEIRGPVVTRSGQVFCVARTRSGAEVRRLSLEGAAPRVVVSGIFDPDFAVSPDERFVVYSALHEGESRLLRASVSGGAPEAVTHFPAFTPAYSPDGKRLAYYFLDRASQRYRIGIAPAQGGPPEQVVEAEPPSAGSLILFRDEGLYLNTMPGDRANVWLQPLDGKPPRRVTDFQEYLVYGFDVSPDGESLAFSRGPRTRDALLIKGFR